MIAGGSSLLSPQVSKSSKVSISLSPWKPELLSSSVAGIIHPVPHLLPSSTYLGPVPERGQTPARILRSSPETLKSNLRRRSSTLTISTRDRKSTRLNSSHQIISYAVFCLKKKNNSRRTAARTSSTRPSRVRRSAGGLRRLASRQP